MRKELEKFRNRIALVSGTVGEEYDLLRRKIEQRLPEGPKRRRALFLLKTYSSSSQTMLFEFACSLEQDTTDILKEPTDG